MNRIIFITGATSGIGKACAEKFAASGDDLIINGRRKDRLEELKRSLESQYNIKVFCAPFDVQDKEEVFDCIQAFAGREQREAAKVYEGFIPLTGADIAEAIFYCASMPSNICINELEITCLARANGIYFNRNS
jgi:NADP-dependent 3-hydroxy acid dehydrogenase YdfG